MEIVFAYSPSGGTGRIEYERISAIQEEEPANIPADGSDIDSHIEQLEQLLGKSEFNKDDLQKAIDGMKLSKQMANINHNLHKNKQSAKKSLSIPQNVLSKINDNTKKTLTLQEKIVSDIMKSWDNEEKRASKDITNVLKIEGLIKKE